MPVPFDDLLRMHSLDITEELVAVLYIRSWAVDRRSLCRIRDMADVCFIYLSEYLGQISSTGAMLSSEYVDSMKY